MRLNQFIAKSGFCSRRKAGDLIKKGTVNINGTVVYEPWREVRDKDVVTVGGRTLQTKKNVYVLFNKPKGVTATLKDAFAHKKITDYLPKTLGRIYPVGRLDKDSHGLLILTNDGDLCYRLTHPRFEVEKEYVLWVKGRVTPAMVTMLKKGIRDGGDLLKVKSASVGISKNNNTKITVVISEGKKRHLRRLFGHLGLGIVDLQRRRIGKLRLGGLREGNFKVIDRTALYRLTVNR
jgi:23S rRNA pseudouridine2605 synthase